MLALIGLIVFVIGFIYLMYVDSKYDTPIHKEFEKIANNIGAPTPDTYLNQYELDEGKRFKTKFD